MKLSKLFLAVSVSAMLFTSVADAGSIGRSGGSSSFGGSRSSSTSSFSYSGSKSSSSSTSSFSAPKPAAAPNSIGSGSTVGVRKTDVTNGVKSDIAATKPSGSSYGSTPSYTSPTTPHYSAPAVPAPVVVQGGGGGGFGSSFAGSLTGTMLGNALFGNHGSGGTTVINNGTPQASSGGVVSGPVQSDGFQPQPMQSYPKKEYTVWSFIGDLIGFVLMLAVLVGLAWVCYKGFKMIRNYVNKERGVSGLPFNPTQQFWAIQKAFAAGDVTTLKTLLGPDVVDELTNDLQPSEVNLKNVSHEIRLSNTSELSVWYKFTDAGEDVNQVWHYEKFGKEWKLNGIETV